METSGTRVMHHPVASWSGGGGEGGGGGSHVRECMNVIALAARV